MKINFSEGGYVPDSVTVYNNIALKPGAPDHIVAQLRIEVMQDGGKYSLQTGPIFTKESKGLFYSYEAGVTYRLVIEINHVTTWTSTKWDVILDEEPKAGGYTFVLDGNVDEIDIRRFKK